jgi:hypothetical protein
LAISPPAQKADRLQLSADTAKEQSGLERDRECDWSQKSRFHLVNQKHNYLPFLDEVVTGKANPCDPTSYNNQHRAAYVLRAERAASAAHPPGQTHRAKRRQALMHGVAGGGHRSQRQKHKKKQGLCHWQLPCNLNETTAVPFALRGLHCVVGVLWVSHICQNMTVNSASRYSKPQPKGLAGQRHPSPPVHKPTHSFKMAKRFGAHRS